MERFEEKEVKKFWKWQSAMEDIYPLLDAVGRELMVRDNLSLRRLYGKQYHEERQATIRMRRQRKNSETFAN